jgi:hypothetical protein
MAKEKPLEETLDDVREDDGQIYVPRDEVDFDPDDGLLSGTAIDGTSDIPDEPSDAAGSDEQGSDAEKPDSEKADGEGSGSEKAGSDKSDDEDDSAHTSEQ